jgi:hypothetical protein
MAWLDRGFRPQQASHQIERRPSGMCDIERNVDILINMKLKGCMIFPLQAGSASTKIVEPGGSECAGDDNGHRVLPRDVMRINGKLSYDAKRLQSSESVYHTTRCYASFTGILSGGVSDAELRQRA